jgi:hypothetical protein
MNKKYFSWKWLITGFCILFLVNCKTPYDPPIKSSHEHFLVVEGYVNGNGPSNIKLSRTRNITWGDTAANINETGARLELQDSNNNSFPLYEAGNGNYTGYFYLYSGNEYRLHITTADHKEYLSDFVPFKQSPPIDKVGWNMKDGGVQIYVNTHDRENKTIFYRWNYEETWEFHSQYYSMLKYNPVDTNVIPRSFPVYQCWRSQNSTTILLGSSAKLKEDVINAAPMLYIPEHDKRISVLYSVLVTQYALDSSAYNYWNAMKGNTENMGSIFDPQPNMTRGNIHCVSDPSETVIGYIGAGNSQQQRIFIRNSELPSGWNLIPNCTEYTVPNIKDSLFFYFSNNSFIPYSQDFTTGGYLSASGSCVDCTLTGTPVKPTFWP